MYFFTETFLLECWTWQLVCDEACEKWKLFLQKLGCSIRETPFKAKYKRNCSNGSKVEHKVTQQAAQTQRQNIYSSAEDFTVGAIKHIWLSHETAAAIWKRQRANSSDLHQNDENKANTVLKMMTITTFGQYRANIRDIKFTPMILFVCRPPCVSVRGPVPAETPSTSRVFCSATGAQIMCHWKVFTEVFARVCVEFLRRISMNESFLFLISVYYKYFITFLSSIPSTPSPHTQASRL